MVRLCAEVLRPDRVMHADAAATTRFVRPAVDNDDTIPVALYSTPYERLDLEARPPPPRPSPAPRLFVLALFVAAFASGFGLVVAISP